MLTLRQLDNDSETIIRLIAKTFEGVTPSPSRPWNSRVVLGCWAAKFLPLVHHYMPDYPITHIGFSTTYARQFFEIPNVSFNMLLPVLQGPGGRKFIRDAHLRERPVFAWTVNAETRMEWCIRRELDGVITDDPKLFIDVCDKYDESKPERWMTIGQLLDALRVWLFALVLGSYYRRRFERRIQIQPQLLRDDKRDT